MTWQPPETAPKDRCILADVGWPWAVVVCWSEYAGKWLAAELQWSMCDGKPDPMFINEAERDLKAWQELPALELPNGA